MTEITMEILYGFEFPHNILPYLERAPCHQLTEYFWCILIKVIPTVQRNVTNMTAVTIRKFDTKSETYVVVGSVLVKGTWNVLTHTKN